MMHKLLKSAELQCLLGCRYRNVRRITAVRISSKCVHRSSKGLQGIFEYYLIWKPCSFRFCCDTYVFFLRRMQLQRQMGKSSKHRTIQGKGKNSTCVWLLSAKNGYVIITFVFDLVGICAQFCESCNVFIGFDIASYWLYELWRLQTALFYWITI